MNRLVLTLVLSLLSSITFAEAKITHLQFTDDVAYSQPTFYLLAITSFILLGGIMLFQSSLVALAKVGHFNEIGQKAQRILRNGFFAILFLIAVLFSVIYFADNSIISALHLEDNAFKALSAVVFLELAIITYTYVLIRVAGKRKVSSI